MKTSDPRPPCLPAAQAVPVLPAPQGDHALYEVINQVIHREWLICKGNGQRRVPYWCIPHSKEQMVTNGGSSWLHWVADFQLKAAEGSRIPAEGSRRQQKAAEGKSEGGRRQQKDMQKANPSDAFWCSLLLPSAEGNPSLLLPSARRHQKASAF